jgi:CDP-diglyceride synthetase
MNQNIKTIYMYCLGALVVAAFAAAIYMILTIEIPSPNKEILSILIGVLGAKFSDVVGYFFGSSAGSASKDQTIKDLKNGVPPQPPV